MADYCYLSLGSLCLGSVDVSISGTPPPASAASASPSTRGPAPWRATSPAGPARHGEHRQRQRHPAALRAAAHRADHHHSAARTTCRRWRRSRPRSTSRRWRRIASATGTTYTTDCDGLLGDLEESLIGQAIGDVGALFADGMQDFLNEVDGNGNTPIAGAIETALAGIDIAGPVGDGLGIDLYAPFTVDQRGPDRHHVRGQHRGDRAVAAAGRADVAGELPRRRGVPDVRRHARRCSTCPTASASRISTSGFNQLLRAQIEGGLLQSTITTIDLGSGPVPVTAGLLAALFPEFGTLPPATPITIRIAPTLAPVLTGDSGPAGELGEVRMAQIRAEFVQNIGLPDREVVTWRSPSTRGSACSSPSSPAASASCCQPPGPTDVTIALLDNPLGVSETTLQTFLPR